VREISSSVELFDSRRWRSSLVERVEPFIIHQFNSYIILGFEFEIETRETLQKLHGDRLDEIKLREI